MTKESRLPRGYPARSRSSPGWEDRAAAAAASRPGAEDQPPPAAEEEEGEQEDDAEKEDAPGPRSPAKATHRTARRPIASSRTCTRHQRQLLSPGKGVRAAARLQGKVLTLPNCSIFRFCCLSAAAGQVMLAGSRGEHRGGEAAPDASALRPARRPLRARRAQRPLPGSAGSAGSAGSGLLRAPPDSGRRRRRRRRPGSESSRRRARRSARPAAAAGASLGPPPCGAPRAARATCAAAAAAAAEGEAPPAARGSLSLHLCLGGRLGRLASEEASAPPPKPALGAEHAQCRRESAALRRAHSTSPGFRGSSSRREGRRPRVGRGPSILGNARPGLEMGGCLGTRGKLEGTWEGLEPWVGPVLKGPVSSFTCKMLTLYCDGADVSLQTKGQGWRGSRIAGVCLGGGGQAECACFWMEVDALKSCGSRAKKAGHPSAVFPHRLSNLTVSSSAYIKHAFRGWRDILVKQNPSGFESGMYVNFRQERPLSSLELE
ncbi:dapper homolog 3-like [Equus caballus]|uniref:dapper homolog 3-like n=1 Tax=Equus caballus TaxID=9796 RepID=UPI0038B3C975